MMELGLVLMMAFLASAEREGQIGNQMQGEM